MFITRSLIDIHTYLQTISNPACLTVPPQVKRDHFTDSDTNENTQDESYPRTSVTVTEENKKELNEDLSITCTNTVS